MKLLKSVKLAALLTATIATVNPIMPVSAQEYQALDVKQDSFIPVALPLGGGTRYNLLLIEQIPGKKQCWSETGSAPVKVNLLLNEFDFTGICKTYKDSNSYSIRIDNVDSGRDYRLDVEIKNNELELIGTPLSGNVSKIVIGRTNGLGDGKTSLKFELEPGWSFSQRTYQNKPLGHMYFTGDSTAFATAGPAPAFRDIARDKYRPEIEEAVTLGFIKGFEDKTFRPQEALTRAQIVSMAFDALGTIKGVTLPDVSNKPSAAPFADVPTSHWASAKIKWAQENGIVKGNPDGSFKPNNPVTRGELMAILKKTTLYGQKISGKTEGIVANGQPTNFSDISGHWSAPIVTEMSTFCKVASPLNETGTAFAPNSSAFRNYAAAATLRMLKCVNPSS